MTSERKQMLRAPFGSLEILSIILDPDNVALTLNVVLLPRLASEQEDGDAGCDAGQGHVQPPALTQVLRHVVDLAAAAPSREAAWRMRK